MTHAPRALRGSEAGRLSPGVSIILHSDGCTVRPRTKKALCLPASVFSRLDKFVCFLIWGSDFGGEPRLECRGCDDIMKITRIYHQSCRETKRGMLGFCSKDSLDGSKFCADKRNKVTFMTYDMCRPGLFVQTDFFLLSEGNVKPDRKAGVALSYPCCSGLSYGLWLPTAGDWKEVWKEVRSYVMHYLELSFIPICPFPLWLRYKMGAR